MIVVFCLEQDRESVVAQFLGNSPTSFLAAFPLHLSAACSHEGKDLNQDLLSSLI